MEPLWRRITRKRRKQAVRPEDHHHAVEYATHALDREAEDRFRAILSDCDICAAEVRQTREAIGRLASSTKSRPPGTLRRRIAEACDLSLGDLQALGDDDRLQPSLARDRMEPQP